MTQPLLCVYHGSCDDGFGAAWAVRHARPDTEFYAAVHSGKPPDVRGRDVVFVDFCYPRAVMDTIIADANSVLVLDHHKSSFEDMLNWAKDRPVTIIDADDLNGIVISSMKADRSFEFEFDMKRSGAMMAWNHYHPRQTNGKAPLFIQYIQDRDLWTKAFAEIDEFTAGLRSQPMTFEIWDDMFLPGFYGAHKKITEATTAEFNKERVERVIGEGMPVLRYQRQLVETAVKNSFWVEIDVPDHVTEKPVVNGMSAFPYKTIRIRGANVMPAISSEVGEELALRYGGIGMTWVEGYKWTYGLRSRQVGDQPAPDVSKIAVAMGGGGHAQASGFKSMTAVHRKAAPQAQEDDGE